jgi:hypothetical protein
MKTQRWVKVLMLVLAVGLAASAIAVLAQQGGVAVPAAAPSSSINAMVVIGNSGGSSIIAAGTNDGIRVFEVRRSGNYYEVQDVTRSVAGGAPVIRSGGVSTPPPEETASERDRLPRTMDRGFTVPPPATRSPAELPAGLHRR